MNEERAAKLAAEVSRLSKKLEPATKTDISVVLSSCLAAMHVTSRRSFRDGWMVGGGLVSALWLVREVMWR